MRSQRLSPIIFGAYADADWQRGVIQNVETVVAAAKIAPLTLPSYDVFRCARFTVSANDPAIYLAVSSDAGKTFATRTKLSPGTTDPTHPQIEVKQDRLGIAFQACDAKAKGGCGKMGVYYREIHADGAMSALVRAGEGKAMPLRGRPEQTGAFERLR